MPTLPQKALKALQGLNHRINSAQKRNNLLRKEEFCSNQDTKVKQTSYLLHFGALRAELLPLQLEGEERRASSSLTPQQQQH